MRFAPYLQSNAPSSLPAREPTGFNSASHLTSALRRIPWPLPLAPHPFLQLSWHQRPSEKRGRERESAGLSARAVGRWWVIGDVSGMLNTDTPNFNSTSGPCSEMMILSVSSPCFFSSSHSFKISSLPYSFVFTSHPTIPAVFSSW